MAEAFIISLFNLLLARFSAIAESPAAGATRGGAWPDSLIIGGCSSPFVVELEIWKLMEPIPWTILKYKGYSFILSR